MEQELEKLGLSKYESLAYLTLFREGTLTGNRLSKLSGIPQGKVYDTIYRLSEKGFISIMNSKPKLFKAIKPEIALKQFISKKREFLEELEKELSKKIVSLGNFAKTESETDERVSIFKGKKNAFAPTQFIMSQATKSIDMMFTFEVLRSYTTRILMEKKKHGIKIRILATKKINKSWIKDFIKKGLNVRYYPVEEIRIFIKDKEESVIQIVNPKNLFDRVNILIQSKELSKALTDYFDKVWEKAEIIK